jgi:hypothetical protein
MIGASRQGFSQAYLFRLFAVPFFFTSALAVATDELAAFFQPAFPAHAPIVVRSKHRSPRKSAMAPTPASSLQAIAARNQIFFHRFF